MSARHITAWTITPAMAITGFRFSKLYRHGTTRWHRLVYNMVDTVGANLAADALHHYR